MESVYALLERDDAAWSERFPLLGSLAAALADHVRSPSGAAPVEAEAPDVDEQAAAREALSAALARHEAALRAKASLTVDHPLQLAYEAELDVAYRAAKPKGKIPRQAREITTRYSALVKAERDRVMLELASAFEDVRRAEAEIAP